MNKQLHPVEVLLVAAVLVGWSVLTIARLLLVPLVALVLTLTRPLPPRPCRPHPCVRLLRLRGAVRSLIESKKNTIAIVL